MRKSLLSLCLLLLFQPIFAITALEKLKQNEHFNQFDAFYTQAKTDCTQMIGIQPSSPDIEIIRKISIASGSLDLSCPSYPYVFLRTKILSHTNKLISWSI